MRPRIDQQPTLLLLQVCTNLGNRQAKAATTVAAVATAMQLTRAHPCDHHPPPTSSSDTSLFVLRP